MNVYARGDLLAARLCNALGIDGEHVRRVVIDCPADGAAVVYVERLLDRGEADRIERILRETVPPPYVVEVPEGRINLSVSGAARG